MGWTQASNLCQTIVTNLGKGRQLAFRVSSTTFLIDVRPPTANANTQAPCTLVSCVRHPDLFKARHLVTGLCFMQSSLFPACLDKACGLGAATVSSQREAGIEFA